MDIDLSKPIDAETQYTLKKFESLWGDCKDETKIIVE